MNAYQLTLSERRYPGEVVVVAPVGEPDMATAPELDDRLTPLDRDRSPPAHPQRGRADILRRQRDPRADQGSSTRRPTWRVAAPGGGRAPPSQNAADPCVAHDPARVRQHDPRHPRRRSAQPDGSGCNLPRGRAQRRTRIVVCGLDPEDAAGTARPAPTGRCAARAEVRACPGVNLAPRTSLKAAIRGGVVSGES